MKEADADFARALDLHRAGRLDEAAGLYRRCLEARPGDFRARSLLGAIALQRGGHEQALGLIDESLRLEPAQPAALNDRGVCLFGLGRFEEAVASYDRALALAPDFAQAHNNRGNALQRLNRFEAAIASFDRALALAPAYANALSNRGAALAQLRRLPEALADLDRAVALAPQAVQAHASRADVLGQMGRLGEAIASYDHALALAPALPDRRGDRLFTALRACRWEGLETEIGALHAAIARGARASSPFAMVALSSSPEAQLAIARAHAADVARASPAPTRSTRGGRIKIGYFSADLYAHATAALIAGLIERHDRARFEVVGFSFGVAPHDAMRARLEAGFDRFVNVTDRSDRDIAALARDMGVDIAIDLKGYTTGARPGIFAARAAPVQASFLGYPATMGADFIDYLIADRVVAPPDAHAHFVEKIVTLPETYQVNDAERAIAPRSFTREELGLPAQGFVFCCFNNSYKITPDVFSIWMRLLQHTPASVLWLLEDNKEAADNLRVEAERRGVDPRRLVFAARIAMDEHLSRHAHADLVLDTLPCNAHTTASDALWTGVPVVTQLGTTFAGRVGASLLRAIGLTDLVANSSADYEALALGLARDPDRMAALSAKLAANRTTHPLFDTQRFARYIEAGYFAMYARACAGLAPDDIEVAAIA